MATPTRFRPGKVEAYKKLGYWDDTTIADLWDKNARLYPNKEAVVDSQTRLTWAEAKTWIDRLALSLLEIGFKKDEMLVVQLPNCVELVLLRVACEKAGLLVMPVLRTLRHTEMEQILKSTGARGIVIPWRFRDFDYFDMVAQLRPRLPELKHVFCAADPPPPGAIPLRKLLNDPIETRYPPDFLQRTKCTAREFSLVLHTTGTTGFPKFVEFPIFGRILSGKTRVKILGITKDDIVAAIGPAAAGPNVIAHLAAPHVGAKIVLVEHFDAEGALRVVEKEKATIICVVPAILGMMAKYPAFQKHDLSALRMILSTGASLPYQLGLEAEEKFGKPIVQEFGAVDSNGFCIQSPQDSREVRLLTVGKPCAGAEVKLVGDDGKEVAKGGTGEIMGRGPAMDVAYFKDPELTWKAWDADGWFRYGDLGKIDDNGNLVIVGRKKDMIIRGGQNIYPVEVENLLLTCPGVLTVAVVAMPDPVMGERACAYVVTKPGQSLTLGEMVSFLKSKGIAPYKIPERLELVSEMSLIGDQKIDKKRLVQDITQKLKAEGKA